MYMQVLGARAVVAAAGGAVAGTTVAGTLPFTGLSLVWWVLLGATLISIGASLVRTSHVIRRTRRGDQPEVVPTGTAGTS